MPPRFIARNLARPTGVIGRLLMRDMNRRNAAMNGFAVQELAAEPGDRVLEVGFGGGLNLPTLLARSVSVAGADPSADAVAAARRTHADAVRSGRAEFVEALVSALPFPDASFDKAITVNTIYFWPSLGEGFSELRRVLKEGGRLVVGFLPAGPMSRMNLPPDLFSMREEEAVATAMQAAGFTDVTSKRPASDTPWLAIAGRR